MRPLYYLASRPCKNTVSILGLSREEFLSCDKYDQQSYPRYGNKRQTVLPRPKAMVYTTIYTWDISWNSDKPASVISPDIRPSWSLHTISASVSAVRSCVCVGLGSGFSWVVPFQKVAFMSAPSSLQTKSTLFRFGSVGVTPCRSKISVGVHSLSSINRPRPSATTQVNK